MPLEALRNERRNLLLMIIEIVACDELDNLVDRCCFEIALNAEELGDVMRVLNHWRNYYRYIQRLKDCMSTTVPVEYVTFQALEYLPVGAELENSSGPAGIFAEAMEESRAGGDELILFLNSY